jgi:hypothetical protein
VQLADGHTVVRLVLEPQHLAPCKAKCNQQLKNETKTQKWRSNSQKPLTFEVISSGTWEHTCEESEKIASSMTIALPTKYDRAPTVSSSMNLVVSSNESGSCITRINALLSKSDMFVFCLNSRWTKVTMLANVNHAEK